MCRVLYCLKSKWFQLSAVLLIMLVGLVSIVLVFLCVSWATVSVHLFVPCCPAVMLQNVNVHALSLK